MKKLTGCIHAGTHRNLEKAVNTPIYQSSTFRISEKDYSIFVEGNPREINIYTRYGNPTVRAVEEKLALLEDAEDAVAFSSGMAAISTTLLTFLKPGDTLLTTLDLYGGTTSFIRNILNSVGVKVLYAEPTDTEKILEQMPVAKALFFESLSNPLLKMVDLESVSRKKKEHQILIVDNTFLTPINFNPIDYGADLVIHSASKYLNGHSDLIAGFVAGRKELVQRVWEKMILLGGSMEPISAYLLERGMKTLGVRVDRHNENAKIVAEFLKSHKKVERVIYPGLPDYPQKDLADRYLTRGGGGMVTFIIEGGDEAGLKFMKRLNIVVEATSLGGVESLVSMPFNTSHAKYSETERRELGILPGTIRLSVGIEDVEDLIDDIKNALDF